MTVEPELQDHLKSIDALEEKRLLSKIINWIIRNIKFIFIPGYRIKALTKREDEYERTRGKRHFIRRLRSKLTILGLILILFVVSFAVFGPWLSPYTYEEARLVSTGQWAPPSPAHPLGQTFRGRDVLARIIYGANSSLIIACLSVFLGAAIGITIGLIAAYYGKWFDMIMMRIMDIILAFPGIVLAIAIITVTGRRSSKPLIESYRDIILIFGLINVPYFARLIRGSVLQARELPYVSAAKVIGASNSRIMFKHILPNSIQPLIISASFKIGSVVISLSVLSFLGFGDSRMIDWGNDILTARSRIVQAPWASLWPSFMILVTVLGFMLLGDGLRDAFDPYLRRGIKV